MASLLHLRSSVSVWRIGFVFLVFCCTCRTILAAEFFHDFRGGSLEAGTFNVVGPESGLESSDDGLQINNQSGVENIGIDYPLPLGGDFLVEADVTLLSVPTPSSGYGTGVAILLEDRINQGASLQFVRSPDGKLQFIAHHFVVDSSGEYSHAQKTFETEDDAATLRLKRVGGSLIYEVSPTGHDSFRTLHNVAFSKRPMQTIQVYGQTGGHANALSVLIRDLRIQAEGIGQSAADFDGSSVDWWMAAIAFVAIPLVIALLAWYFRRNR